MLANGGELLDKVVCGGSRSRRSRELEQMSPARQKSPHNCMYFVDDAEMMLSWGKWYAAPSSPSEETVPPAPGGGSGPPAARKPRASGRCVVEAGLMSLPLLPQSLEGGGASSPTLAPHPTRPPLPPPTEREGEDVCVGALLERRSAGARTSPPPDLASGEAPLEWARTGFVAGARSTVGVPGP